jgi:uncharacterized membrane protein YoaK (UPF0700 family)
MRLCSLYRKKSCNTKPPLILFTQVPSTAFMMAFIAGLLDVFGFISLSQLFTAHITGNIVIAIAGIVHHSPGVAAKLISLPVFIVVAMVVTWVIEYVGQTKSLLVTLLLAEAVFLVMFLFAGFYVIPFNALDSWAYISSSMLAVSAMAIHNTLLRTFMASFPPCTVMTGNFCQMIVDTVSYCCGKRLSYPIENLATSISGIRRFGNVLLGFLLGGVIAAVGFSTIGFWTISFGILLLVFMSTK